MSSPPSPCTIIPSDWPGCNAADIEGDFDHNGRPTLGDAVFVAEARLQYGSTGINAISCLSGDFDSDSSFTLNDAATVAEAQFEKQFLPWEAACAPGRPRYTRHLSTTSDGAKKGSAMLIDMKAVERGSLQVHLHIADASDQALERSSFHADRNGQQGAWKALSVQFTGGTIAAVHILHGAPGQVTTQHRGGFFQAADLSGAGAAWPAGLAATVTFEAGTDMSALRIDQASMNTYAIALEDPACKPGPKAPCATVRRPLKSVAMPPLEAAQP